MPGDSEGQGSDVLWSMGLQRVRHNIATEQQLADGGNNILSPIYMDPCNATLGEKHQPLELRCQPHRFQAQGDVEGIPKGPESQLRG